MSQTLAEWQTAAKEGSLIWTLCILLEELKLNADSLGLLTTNLLFISITVSCPGWRAVSAAVFIWASSPFIKKGRWWCAALWWVWQTGGSIFKNLWHSGYCSCMIERQLMKEPAKWNPLKPFCPCFSMRRFWRNNFVQLCKLLPKSYLSELKQHFPLHCYCFGLLSGMTVRPGFQHVKKNMIQISEVLDLRYTECSAGSKLLHCCV